MSRNITRRDLIAVTPGLLMGASGIDSLAKNAQQMQPKRQGFQGTINHKTREIFMVGELNDEDNFNTVIAVILLNVPEGEWTITKVEHNRQSKPWGLWALQHGFSTRYKEGMVPSANYFSRFTIVSSRNCLVFDDGAVQPGQTLIKRWSVVHGEGPMHVLHYERPGAMSTPLTHDEIIKGWGNKVIDQVINVTLQEIASTV